MATSKLACLWRAGQILQHSLFRESQLAPRALTQVQFVRERRRTCHPPRWFVPRKNKIVHLTEEALTPENKDFLEELVEEKYKDLSATQSPLKDGPLPRNEWNMRSTKRAGLLAIKIGVLPQWRKDGKKFHTTLLQVLDNHVIRYSPPEEFQSFTSFKPHWKRYGSLVVGALSCDPKMYTKAYNNLFLEAGVPPKRKLTRFLITPDAALEAGTPLNAMHFRVGDYVDVQSKTIGHGFQGVVKRWGFKGGPATHGSSKFHRRPGSISSGRMKPGVIKGKKLPGHMGMDWRHLKGLKIWRINTKYNVLYVHGPCIPGPNHCYVRVMDTRLPNRRKELKSPPPMPTFYPEDVTEPIPEELFEGNLHQFTEPTLTFQEKAAS